MCSTFSQTTFAHFHFHIIIIIIFYFLSFLFVILFYFICIHTFKINMRNFCDNFLCQRKTCWFAFDSGKEKTKWKLQRLLFIFALGIHFCLRQRKICDCFCLHSFLFYPAHRPCGLNIFTQFKCTPLSYLWVVKLLRYFETSLSVTKCQNFSFQFNLTLSGKVSNFSFKRIFSLNFSSE